MYVYIYPLFLVTHSLIHMLTQAIMHTHITLEPQETRYSEVFWTAQPKVDLPSEVKAQFKGKAISITGFEVDVMDENNESVPEFLVYNHHYCATLLSDSSQMVKIGSRQQDSLLRDDKDRYRRRAFEVHPPEWEPREITGLDDDSSTIPTAHNFWQGTS